MRGLTGKTVIVTGGASGIGRAGAIAFADEGCRIVIADLHQRAGEEVADQIRARGGEAVALEVDVGDTDSVRTMVAKTVERFGRVDVLFTNAADVKLIDTRDACAVDLDEDVFDQIHRVILRGVFLCAKYAGRGMIKAGNGGAMVFTATVDAQIGCAGLDAYTAAKGGVVAMTRSLAAGLAKHGIRVNAISPGFVATEGHQYVMRDPKRRAAMESFHLLPMTEPRHVVPLAVFLASDEASHITGSIHQVDSGYMAFKAHGVDVMDMMRDVGNDDTGKSA